MAQGEWALTSGDGPGIFWDAQNKPYWLTNKGNKSYIPPIAAMQSSDPKLQAWALTMGATPQNPSGPMPGASYLKERGYWDDKTGRVKQGTNWNNIIATAVGAGIGAGAVSAFSGAAGAGGTAAGSAGTNAAIDTSIGGAAGMAETVPYGVGTAAGVASAAGAPGATPPPLGGVKPGGTTAGATAGQSLLDKLTSTEGMASLAPLIASLMNGGLGGSQPQESPEMRRMNQMTEARLRRTDPLHEAVSQLTYSRLPTAFQNGPLPRVPLPPLE